MICKTSYRKVENNKKLKVKVKNVLKQVLIKFLVFKYKLKGTLEKKNFEEREFSVEFGSVEESHSYYDEEDSVLELSYSKHEPKYVISDETDEEYLLEDDDEY